MIIKCKKYGEILNGYEGYYQVSNLGRVKSLPRFHKTDKNYSSIGYISKEKILKLTTNNHGYATVVLSIHDIHKTKTVHRLVCKAFIPNPNNYPVINHKDGNKLNNNIDNLEWCTQKYNAKHAWENGLSYKTEKQINIIKIKKKKRILQYSKDNQFIKEWEGIKDASKELGINANRISMCAKGRCDMAGGFLWKFVKG